VSTEHFIRLLAIGAIIGIMLSPFLAWGIHNWIHWYLDGNTIKASVHRAWKNSFPKGR
jgi:hypothetical protein